MAQNTSTKRRMVTIRPPARLVGEPKKKKKKRKEGKKKDTQTVANWLFAQSTHVFGSGLELPPGMPGISPALVGCIPGSVVGKAVAAGDAVCPWLCH